MRKEVLAALKQLYPKCTKINLYKCKDGIVCTIIIKGEEVIVTEQFYKICRDIALDKLCKELNK